MNVSNVTAEDEVLTSIPISCRVLLHFSPRHSSVAALESGFVLTWNRLTLLHGTYTYLANYSWLSGNTCKANYESRMILMACKNIRDIRVLTTA